MTPRDKLIKSLQNQHAIVNLEEDEGDFVVWWKMNYDHNDFRGRNFHMEAVNPLTNQKFVADDVFWELDNFWKRFDSHMEALRSLCRT